jgi:hypothetical protein
MPRRPVNSDVSPPFLPTHFSPCIFKRHLPSQASIRWVFGACSGFACVGCASFKTFWPLALVQQALAALVFVVRGLCGHFRFCALGLTRRSSRPAYCGRLILFVRRRNIAHHTSGSQKNACVTSTAQWSKPRHWRSL